jgi:hypothetical protein
MSSLVYVSRPTIAIGDRADELDDILAVSAARNSALDITGLLIATPDYFAQLLEGPSASIDEVMASIMADNRHHDVRVVRRSDDHLRRYPAWRMARFERENFGTFRTGPLLAACHLGEDRDALAKLERLVDAIALGRVSVRPRPGTGPGPTP